MSAPASAPGLATLEVIWHDVENGAYAADLPVWRALSATASSGSSARVLELGCGTGRVALDLARAGHEVLGVDAEAALVAELNRRAAERGLEASAIVADIREPPSAAADGPEAPFALIVAPMQLIQLLRTPADRHAALRAIAASLAPTGRAALAIVEGDPTSGDARAGPALPDVAERDGWVYSSLPLGAYTDQESRVIGVRRLRQIVSPAGELSEDVDVTSLSLMTAAELEAEAAECGLRAAGRRDVPATAEHVGSTVVVLERDEAGANDRGEAAP